MESQIENTIPDIPRNVFISSPDTDEETETSVPYRPWYKKITIEPVIFFFTISTVILKDAKENLFFDKICHIDLNYAYNVCVAIKKNDNQTLYEDIKFNVKENTENFVILEEKCAILCTICLAYFMGGFSDKYGRKILIVIALIANLFYSFMLIIHSLIPSSSKYVLITGTLPMAIFGPKLAIRLACFGYITDITTRKERTLRIAILEGLGFLPFSFEYVIKEFTTNSLMRIPYMAIFAFNFGLTFIIIMYVLIFLKTRSNSYQKSLSEAKHPLFFEFFNHGYLKKIEKLFITTIDRKHVIIRLGLLLFVLYKIQVIEEVYINKYVLTNFNWDVENDSRFQTLMYSLSAFSILILIPFMNKVLRLSNMTILFISIYSCVIAKCLFGYSLHTFFIGEVLYSLSIITCPIILSNLSKSLEKTQQGTLFGLLHVISISSYLCGDFIYYQTFEATSNVDKKKGYGIFSVSLINHIISLGVCFALCYVKEGIKIMKRKKIIVLSTISE